MVLEPTKITSHNGRQKKKGLITSPIQRTSWVQDTVFSLRFGFRYLGKPLSVSKKWKGWIYCVSLTLLLQC